MSIEVLTVALVVAFAFCIALALGWMSERRRARVRRRELQQQVYFYRTHIEKLAASLIDRAYAPMLSERLQYALTPLIYPPDGLLYERRACMEYHERSRTQPLTQLRQMKDQPIGQRKARLMARVLAYHLAVVFLTANWHIDLVTAVPSSQAHFARRGYNPAHLLAVETARIIKIDYKPVLTRLRETGSQREQGSRAARLQNVQGAFKASGRVKGKRVLIVEDVVTTGATLAACAAALHESGAERIYALSLASVGRPRPATPSPAETAWRG